jgi:hypothetical protein
MKQEIIIECLAREIGMEITSIALIFPENLGITDRCYITNALHSNETKMLISTDMLYMHKGHFGFFIKPLNFGVYGLMDFFFKGGETCVTRLDGNLQFSKKRTDNENDKYFLEAAHAA